MSKKEFIIVMSLYSIIVVTALILSLFNVITLKAQWIITVLSLAAFYFAKWFYTQKRIRNEHKGNKKNT